MKRTASVERKTSESSVFVELNLDGAGISSISTTVPFFDHMLTALSKHSLIDLKVEASGDTEIDVHHTVEDVSIALGTALKKALGDKKGIERFGSAYCPLDESLARAVVDLSGRTYLSHTGEPYGQEYHLIGGHFTGSLTRHCFEAISSNAEICLHIDVLKGRDPHHIVEAQFKAFAKALKMAVSYDERIKGANPFNKRCALMPFSSDLESLAASLPEGIFDELEGAGDTEQKNDRWSAIKLPLINPIAAAAFLKMYDFEAKVMTNGTFGALIFPKEKDVKKVVEKIVQITTEINDFQMQLFRYEYNFLIAELYENGKVVEQTPPPLVLVSVSELAEQAILQRVDFYSEVQREEIGIEEVYNLDDVKKVYKEHKKIEDIESAKVIIFDSRLLKKADAWWLLQEFVERRKNGK